MIIAIDGPAASGKGTLGKRLAAHYGLRHLDTGLLYRAVAQAEMRRKALSQSALAGCGRPVDGDDHDKSPPIALIISTKPGKLVWMNAVSSTRTGLSLARPIASADIAMR